MAVLTSNLVIAAGTKNLSREIPQHTRLAFGGCDLNPWPFKPQICRLQTSAEYGLLVCEDSDYRIMAGRSHAEVLQYLAD